MAEEHFVNATFEEKMKVLVHMSEADQARSAEKAMGSALDPDRS